MSDLSIRLRDLKEVNEDYEFFPTSNEILQAIKKDLQENERFAYKRFNSLLDVGAGSGKVLQFFEDNELCREFYVIEKSFTHLETLKPKYNLVGVDFHNVNLYNVDVDLLFSNPPYSEYVSWVTKIIQTASRKAQIYLVIPDRWQNNEEIQEVIRGEDAKVEILGSFSFLNSEDRKARANVNLLSIHFDKIHEADPFVKFFDEAFTYPTEKESDRIDFKEQVQNELVGGANLIEVLCTLFDKRQEELRANYTAICTLDLEILKEFEISRASLIESLKRKLDSNKKQFWQRLFDGMESINKLLTSKTRKAIVSKMQEHNGIDFNRDNAYAVVMWVLKNVNSYFNPQFIETYEKMINYANVEAYVSNQRVFKQNDFNYSYWREETSEVTHYKLKIGHRIVLERSGGLSKDWGGRIKISEYATDFILDLLIIANNLGFRETGRNWSVYDICDSGAHEFYYRRGDEHKLLFSFRAYQNGNMHIQFNPDFLHALNIQHGKLKGWIKNTKEAAQEIVSDEKISEEEIQKFFDITMRIGNNQLLLN